MNGRKNIIDRRKKIRTPFTDRRKRKFLEAFSAEVDKLAILKQKKQNIIEQAQKFIKSVKITPRQVKADYLKNYLAESSPGLQ